MEAEGSGTLSEKYKEARLLLVRAKEGLELLESASSMAPDLLFAVEKDISNIRSICADMGQAVPSQPQPDDSKR